MEDLEIIYEELLHIKALSHLSTMVKRELASVLVFESHAKAGTVCKYFEVQPLNNAFPSGSFVVLLALFLHSFILCIEKS